VNSTFVLNVDRNPDQSFILRVELRKKLDREVDDFYQFYVTAKDGGSPPNIGTMTVNDHNQISFAELFPLFLNLN
jgi:hypothetical protein